MLVSPTIKTNTKNPHPPVSLEIVKFFEWLVWVTDRTPAENTELIGLNFYELFVYFMDNISSEKSLSNKVALRNELMKLIYIWRGNPKDGYHFSKHPFHKSAWHQTRSLESNRFLYNKRLVKFVNWVCSIYTSKNVNK